MTLPAVGSPAPPFKLLTATGAEVSLADYRGVSRVVLWFSKGLF